ncbi:hypothetical protein DFJ73DRAFT_771806 [Zopfochytrium polystomum]|nr:hypothetical protein DFJ73DRAFT_771806 [Zopfochytrium polystomum]
MNSKERKLPSLLPDFWKATCDSKQACGSSRFRFWLRPRVAVAFSLNGAALVLPAFRAKEAATGAGGDKAAGAGKSCWRLTGKAGGSTTGKTAGTRRGIGANGGGGGDKGTPAAGM